jgi:hypothetical protein
MDKTYHTVTVPREYLEMLEEFFEVNSKNEKNIHGEIKTINTNHLSFGQLKTLPSYKALFIYEDLREVESVICTDSEGREFCRFIKHLIDF